MLFSALEQTHCILVVCNSECMCVCVFVCVFFACVCFIIFFIAHFLNIHQSGLLTALFGSVLHGWYHMKLLPSQHMFCVHHMNYAPVYSVTSFEAT